MQISLKQVAHLYQEGTPFEFRAIYDINVEFPSGSFIGVIGHTGSGKSTLLQHLNALLKPSEGMVTIGERTITSDKKVKNLKPIRKQVGIVFQFPEHQLFEETVEKDICFGPMNFGVSEEEAKIRARAALELVGLCPDPFAGIIVGERQREKIGYLTGSAGGGSLLDDGSSQRKIVCIDSAFLHPGALFDIRII